MYEIRDPVHRTIEFDEKEKTVIDHPCVQRLRFIRQLGMTFLVYPGAEHDRFSHAIGAMHVAGRVWKRIEETSGKLLREYFNREELAYFRRILRLAALLHDVGHPPFSHVSEKFMPSVGSLFLPWKWFKGINKNHQATHEDYSVLLISSLGLGKKAIFTNEEAQDIASLVHYEVLPSKKWDKLFGHGAGRKGIHALLRSLISGELDVDRMDYLLRDGHFTGVTYGFFDIDHIIQNLGITINPKKELVLTLDSTAVRAFEDFLLARYHMFLQVYLHKTTLSFDYFLGEALADNELALNFSGDPDEYLDLRDSTLIEKLFESSKKIKNSWSSRLLSRKPGKLILSASHVNGKKLIGKLEQKFKKEKIKFFTVEARQYLSKLRSRRSKNKSSFLVRRKMLGKVFYEPIDKYSSLLNRYNEIIDLKNLYVLSEQVSRAKKIIANIDIKRPSIF